MNAATLAQNAEAKFTPGPWLTPNLDEPYSSRQFWVTDADGELIAAVAGDNAEAEANARLIAAAPKLLSACQAQHDAIDRLFALCIEHVPGFLPSKSAMWQACVDGHAAITKATGAAS